MKGLPNAKLCKNMKTIQSREVQFFESLKLSNSRPLDKIEWLSNIAGSILGCHKIQISIKADGNSRGLVVNREGQKGPTG